MAPRPELTESDVCSVQLRALTALSYLLAVSRFVKLLEDPASTIIQRSKQPPVGHCIISASGVLLTCNKNVHGCWCVVLCCMQWTYSADVYKLNA